MRHRTLGRSGLRVSEIAYGSWISTTERSAAEVAQEALRQGITTFDTADVYGGSLAEEVLGRVLSGVRRESVEICTKVCSPVGPGANDRGLSRKHIMEAAHGSLKRLKTDYIDVYQAHRFDARTPLEETLRAFDDLVRQGKVLYVGVSEWTTEQITAALEIAGRLGLDRIISNQPQYNMVWRVIEAEVGPLCEREGVGQMVWSPLAQGLLTGKYRAGEPLPTGSRADGPARSQFAAGALAEDVLRRVSELTPLADELGITMPQLALAWVLRNPNVSCAIVGASRPEQIAETAAASGIELADEVVKRIDDILGPIVERDPAKTPAHPTDYGR
ncbi:aldo/keto reductase family protein [Streptomyces sp. SL13]|uniref:Aldo/keto reductase family protein n=1 Tax=Streptantibioticus silvisoli TaxID=2705255 RepID=A0AA90H5K4_9ACTN|nr:aldo/keto reductase family protein [Streptantibioticus silvisoli]MDI5966646.1 aldo/keto reductase family protein [Streptantibioticus silvisoli]MDI5970802.1 aldo/keto reductase family protein [Streptantibioticus silvisoli]